jgi:polyisoprenoid-binding protein YceI
MALRTGRYVLGPQDGTVLVMTGREGPAARMGHELTLEATRWNATVVVDVEDPSRSKVTVSVDAGSLVVLEARGGPLGLSHSQRAEVERIIRETVLRSGRHPRITFRSTAVSGDARRASVTGNLSIRRRTRPVTLELRVTRAKLPRIVATAAIVQTDFGIQPYAALRGALRVTDSVDLRVEVLLR